MAVSISNLTTGKDTSKNSVDTASISPGSNNLVLVLVKSRLAAGTDPATPTLSGNGITYTQIATIVTDNAGTSRQRMTLFRGSNASPSSGAITIDFGGETQTHVGWVVDEASSVDNSTNDGVVQSATNVYDSSHSPSETSITATLSSFADSGNAAYGAFGNGNDVSNATPGSGFGQVGNMVDDVNGSMELLTEYKNSEDDTVDVTFDSDIECGIVAIEITAAAGASAPTVTTSAATSVTNAQATGNGEVTDDGGDTITERGFVLSESANPTTADTKYVVAGTTGSFNGTMDGLDAGTHYHYRAYATNGVGTSYGADTEFDTDDVPTVTTSAADNIDDGQATGHGNVTDDGGDTITERGFVLSESANPTTSDTKYVVAGTTGSYNGTMDSLDPNTHYHYRAYATNTYGTSYGADTEFDTLDYPTVTTSAATGVGMNEATGNGNVTDDGNDTISERGFVLSESANPTTSDTKYVVAGTTGAYNGTMDSLSSSTTYHYRAYAINSIGTSYGSDQQFTTTSAPNSLTITNEPIDMIASHDYKFGIYLKSNITQAVNISILQNDDSSNGLDEDFVLNVDEWKHLEFEFTALATDSACKLVITPDPDQIQELYIDKVELFDLTIERKDYRIMQIQGVLSGGMFIQDLYLREITDSEDDS